ncbi:MAG: hypothetical protein KJ710_08550, partial [Candidatus Omnitrophica bacterium]|nr:hypothetical protein [Candidatus Omnitrophota bacterium]
MKIFRKKEAFIEIIMLLLLTGFIFMPGKVSAQSTCSTETRQGNGGGCESADDGDPTFIQISRRVIPCANYDKPKLELSSGSSTNILFSYDKSLITTTAEMDVISSLPDWLNIAVDSEVTDLGDPNLNFIKITFMVTANVLPNSHSEIKLRLVDEGPGETRAVKKVIITVDRTLFSQINVPAEGSLVRAEVPIFGLAYGEDFSHYTIEFGEGYDPNIWIPITTSYTPQTNDTSP